MTGSPSSPVNYTHTFKVSGIYMYEEMNEIKLHCCVPIMLPLKVLGLRYDTSLPLMSVGQQKNWNLLTKTLNTTLTIRWGVHLLHIVQ